MKEYHEVVTAALDTCNEIHHFVKQNSPANHHVDRIAKS